MKLRKFPDGCGTRYEIVYVVPSGRMWIYSQIIDAAAPRAVTAIRLLRARRELRETADTLYSDGY